MKEIKLTQGKVALVDDEDYEILRKWKWCFIKSQRSGLHYAVRGVKKSENLQKSHISMHRVIMAAPEGMQVDHIDHNGLNNQKSNLRICSPNQNACNRRKQNNNSGYKGVTAHRGKRKYINKKGQLKIYRSKRMYVAHISINGRLKDVGRFSKAIDAARAYDKAAKEHYGEFAQLNFTNL